MPIPEWADKQLSDDLPVLRARGEGQDLEYMEVFPEQARDLAKEIAAFASTNPGTILIGVSDAGDLIGLPDTGKSEQRDQLLRRIEGICRGTIKPSITPTVKWAVETGRNVLVIQVSKGGQPVYYSNHIPYVRHLSESRPADPHEVADAARQSADIASRTLDASQRAWIRLDEIGLGNDLTFSDLGCSVTVSFKITNTGNIPANTVTFHAKLVVLKSGGLFPIQEQQRMCGEIRKQPFGNGFTLFPGESFPSSKGFGGWSLGVNASKDEIERGLGAGTGGKHVVMEIVGCIDYTFPMDSTNHHQTGFIRRLDKRGPPFIISPSEGRISVDKLMLSQSAVGLGEYAD